MERSEQDYKDLAEKINEAILVQLVIKRGIDFLKQILKEDKKDSE